MSPQYISSCYKEGVKFFGIDKKVKEPGSTEIVVLDAKNMFMD